MKKRIIIEKERDFDIYTKSGVENFSDNDEIAGFEEGFMSGYLNCY
mgnify:CR=1 FL=1